MMTRREYLRQAAIVGSSLALLNKATLSALAEAVSSGSPRLLKKAAEARGLMAGAAVRIKPLRNDPEYRRVLAEQYDLVVGSNCMKFGPLRPTPTTYNFTDADFLVSFAEHHGMKVRGHNFVWHHQLPSWFATTVNKGNARQILTEHILTVGGRYKGKIQSWDVVNEAINVGDGRPDGLRKSPWLELIGPDYLELAFRTAQQADPHAKLTYNDYGIENESENDAKKRAAVLALIKRLKQQGAPIDALGIQSHLQVGPASRFGHGVRKLIDDVQAMGMDVYITELDVNDDKVPNDDPAVRDRAVAQVYAEYLNCVLQSTAVKAVLTWGFTDRYTWLNSPRRRKLHPDRKERPLPFDFNYQPTPAFNSLYAALRKAPAR